MIRRFIGVLFSVLFTVLLLVATHANAGIDFVGDNNASLRIGCAKNKPQYSFINGSLDEVAVWQRALSDDEIKQAIGRDLLAVSSSDKAATTWADMKKRAVVP